MGGLEVLPKKIKGHCERCKTGQVEGDQSRHVFWVRGAEQKMVAMPIKEGNLSQETKKNKPEGGRE